MRYRGGPLFTRGGVGGGDGGWNASLGARIGNLRSIPPRTSTGMSRGSPQRGYGAPSWARNHAPPASGGPAPGQPAPLVPESVEPIVDVFDEGNRILVVAEIPGADERSIRVEIEDHTLGLWARGKFRDYKGRVGLPAETSPASLAWTLNNGVISLTLARDNGEENRRQQPSAQQPSGQ